MRSLIRLGTRGSKLALAQAEIVSGRIKGIDKQCQIEIKKITTYGDKDQKTSLKEIGGKGIFIREIEHALLKNEIDIAVHSFKDITVQTAEGLSLCGFLKPESCCDVLISKNRLQLKDIPENGTIGTGSMRRKALLKRIRPDIICEDIRGNVDTRINKIEQGLFDGILLSEAGLIRLGLESYIAERFDPEVFIPAPGQGVIALQARTEDHHFLDLCRLVGDQTQFLISNAEYSAIERIGFDCRTPFGIFSRISDGEIIMKAFFENPTDKRYSEVSVRGQLSSPRETGKQLADQLLRNM
ncbi:MAG: hydroxymethylbilane synthase [Fibrobacter sp.]|nr:hydroxymethylbilane synthase [Fibrobacter sp.]